MCFRWMMSTNTRKHCAREERAHSNECFFKVLQPIINIATLPVGIKVFFTSFWKLDAPNWVLNIIRPILDIYIQCDFMCVELSVFDNSALLFALVLCRIWMLNIWRLRDVRIVFIFTVFLRSYVRAYMDACACVFVYVFLAHLTMDKHWRIFLSDAYVNFGIHLTPKLCMSIICHIQCRCRPNTALAISIAKITTLKHIKWYFLFRNLCYEIIVMDFYWKIKCSLPCCHMADNRCCIAFWLGPNLTEINQL